MLIINTKFQKLKWDGIYTQFPYLNFKIPLIRQGGTTKGEIIPSEECRILTSCVTGYEPYMACSTYI